MVHCVLVLFAKRVESYDSFLLNIYMYNILIIFQVLSKGVKLKMSRQEILEKTGELISLRYEKILYIKQNVNKH